MHANSGTSILGTRANPRAIGYGSELGPPTGYGTKRRDAGNGSLTPEQDMQLEKDPPVNLLGQLLLWVLKQSKLDLGKQKEVIRRELLVLLLSSVDVHRVQQ